MYEFLKKQRIEWSFGIFLIAFFSFLYVVIGLSVSPINIRLDRIDGHINKLETSIDKLDGRVSKLETSIDKLDGRVSKLEISIDKLDGRVSKIEQILTSSYQKKVFQRNQK